MFYFDAYHPTVCSSSTIITYLLMYPTLEANNNSPQPLADSFQHYNASPPSSGHLAHMGHNAGERGRTRYRHIDNHSAGQVNEYGPRRNNHRSPTGAMLNPTSPTRSAFNHASPPTDMATASTGQAQSPLPGVQPKLPPLLPPPGSVPSGSGSGSGFVSGIEAAAASALTLANNIAFRPMTTQPAKCSKLKIRIFFDSTIFQAGGNLFGRMEITATSSRSLKLGEIAVELAAYEGTGEPLQGIH